MSDDLPVCDCGYYRDVCGCPEPPPERAILTDLIAELRERAPYYGPATMFVFQGMADRAEARLRELDTPGGE